MGDKLEDACRNHKPVRLILSRGANVSGYIKSFDRQYAQAVIETENGECVIRLGYLIQVFVKGNNGKNESNEPESFVEYAKKHLHDTPKNDANRPVIPKKEYDLGLQKYISQHNYQDKTDRELADIIKNEKFNDTLKRVWLKQIGFEYFSEFVEQQKASMEPSP